MTLAFQAGNTGSNPVGDKGSYRSGGQLAGPVRTARDHVGPNSSRPDHVAIALRRATAAALSVANRGKPLLERLWSRVAKSDGCWVWEGAATWDGYGLIRVEAGKTALVHRVAWEAQHGPVPDGSELDHLCTTRRCVRDSHLEAVSHAENQRRMAERRRAVPDKVDARFIDLARAVGLLVFVLVVLAPVGGAQ